MRRADISQTEHEVFHKLSNNQPSLREVLSHPRERSNKKKTFINVTSCCIEVENESLFLTHNYGLHEYKNTIWFTLSIPLWTCNATIHWQCSFNSILSTVTFEQTKIAQLKRTSLRQNRINLSVINQKPQTNLLTVSVFSHKCLNFIPVAVILTPVFILSGEWGYSFESIDEKKWFLFQS